MQQQIHSQDFQCLKWIPFDLVHLIVPNEIDPNEVVAKSPALSPALAVISNVTEEPPLTIFPTHSSVIFYEQLQR
jgi:hypothetical protein